MDKAQAMKVMAESHRETVAELQIELESFEKRRCPNCHDWSRELAKQCYVCEGFGFFYLKYRTENDYE